MRDAVEEGNQDIMESYETWDDVSGKPLDTSMVKRARKDELEEFQKHGVYHKVPIKECWDKTGKAPLGIRWIDINKGDDKDPEYRSRLVAKEIKMDKREDLFAATPPLEAKKILFSMAVTDNGNRAKPLKLDFIDVRRAYFHARAKREVFIELPEEDMEMGMCGKLDKSMYGTRDAAQNWETEYTAFLTGIGMRQGISNPCIFTHDKRNIRLVIHGDDLTILAEEEDLDWIRKEIVKKFEVKFRARLGPEAKDDKSVRILNRVVEWSKEGIYYEADQRHAEIIVDQLEVRKDKQGLSAPGRKEEDKEKEHDDAEELDKDMAHKYRALTARANYLAQDRVDIRYAVKELARKMAKPTKADWRKLTRLGRYLVDKTRLTIHYAYQHNDGYVTVYTDSDYASCPTTRKSTSGG